MLITSSEANELDEEYCEKLFREKHYRNEEGRYVVPMPFKVDAKPLGPSYKTAVRYFLQQEEKREKNPELKRMLNEFMSEYLNLGHMSKVPKKLQRVESSEVYYLNWMPVLRVDAVTTKLRNVFMAHMKTTTGVSLNDTLCVGPKLQTAIFDLLVASRQHRYVFTADVCKMYRQFLIEKESRDKLRILWRPNKFEPLEEYWLNTVTYGTDCAPWQAIRGVHQIADDNAPDEETKFVVKRKIYMDDLMHGGDEISECKKIILNVTTILEAGKLELTKWSANDPAVLEDIICLQIRSASPSKIRST